MTVPGGARYIALTTYRRNGEAVTTPVWAAPLDGNLYVVTAASTGKARRLRVTDRVRFAACNANGRRIVGESQDGAGRVVEDPARRDQALSVLRKKYGWQFAIAMLVYRIRGLHREAVVLELTPAPRS